MPCVMGISAHTGWAACVVVGGLPTQPVVSANEIIEILEDAQRFCYHLAADMPRTAAEAWLADARTRAIANARRGLAPLLAKDVGACAIVAKNGDAGDLDTILASHPRIHAAEGFFYRDVLRAACPVRTWIVPPATLDPARIGKLAGSPWRREQKMATLAALGVMKGHL